MILKITTHHGEFYQVETFNVDGDEFGVYATDMQWALSQSAYRYDVSIERAEDLTAELDADGRAEHGWSTLELDSGEWA